MQLLALLKILIRIVKDWQEIVGLSVNHRFPGDVF